MTGRIRPWPRSRVEACAGTLSRECAAFFFQAEDGIRDLTVTGVQTCALPDLGGPGPPVVEHPGVGETGADLSELGADAKPLRILERADVPTQPDTAHLAAVVTSARRDGFEVAVEVDVIDQQPLDAPVAVPLAHFLSKRSEEHTS